MNCAPDDEYEDVEDAIEQDVLTAFLAADCNINDKAVCEDIAEYIQCELTAFMAREQAYTPWCSITAFNLFVPPAAI